MIILLYFFVIIATYGSAEFSLWLVVPLVPINTIPEHRIRGLRACGWQRRKAPQQF